MKQEQIFNFINAIIQNGVDNNLSEEVVSKSIREYAQYLKTNNLADDKMITRINKISKNINSFINVEKEVVNKQEPNIVGHSRPSSCHSGRSISHRSC